MREIKFKTNISCGNCLARVKPLLDANRAIEKWSVDLNSENRILVVSGDVTVEEVKKSVMKAGFIAEEV